MSTDDILNSINEGIKILRANNNKMQPGKLYLPSWKYIKYKEYLDKEDIEVVIVDDLPKGVNAIIKEGGNHE